MTVPAVPPGGNRRDLFAEAPIVCVINALQLDRARALARRLEVGLPFARLVECRKGQNGDLVIVDVEVETPQRPMYDILFEERIAVWFGITSEAPEVFALREDFPAAAPHLNLNSYEYPRSFCLYDVSFAEIRSTWTPARFTSLVRDWLRLTALGELHASDQPLEPLIHGGVGWIILPNLLRTDNAAIGIIQRHQIGTMPVLVAVPPEEVDANEKRFVAAVVRTQPRTHGVIRRAPATLADLHELFSPEDNIQDQLADVLRKWKENSVPLAAQVAVVVLVPLRRADDAEPEIDQPWAFLTVQSISDVGQSLGLWEKTEYGLGAIVGASGGDCGTSVQLLPLYAHFDHRREDGARFNGREHPDSRQFVAIGAGALGSQILEAAARTAFGHWTVVDNDVLLPHNLARHALPRSALGWGKAEAVVGGLMNDGAADGAVHKSLAADVLSPNDKAVELSEAYGGAVAIIDMSASVAVARGLARDVEAAARRVSLFLNPEGTDIVLLAENSARTVRLDALEMQYYRAVGRDQSLAGTLQGAFARERYGRSCRDVSSQIPHARVLTLAGIGIQALQRHTNSTEPAIRVWRIDTVSLGVRAVTVPVHSVVEVPVGDWIVVTDVGLLAELAEQRADRLPNETGGVLLGHVDVGRRVVYIADAIPSPPDSEEWPTLYIRGTSGLTDSVKKIEVATAGQLHYVGEWHSHPRGIPALPSQDDVLVFAWITRVLDVDDLPAVMMILDDCGSSLFVGNIDAESPPPRVPFGAVNS